MDWMSVILRILKKLWPFAKKAVIEEGKDTSGVTKYENPNGDAIAANKKSAIIFIHGFKGGMLDTWGDTLAYLRKDKAFDHWDFIALGYNTNLIPGILKGLWTAAPPINVIGQNLKGQIESLLAQGYKSVSICAHSMGGLATQSAVLQLDDQTLSKLHAVIMFGTPSGGLVKARLGRFINDQVKDMAAGSSFVTDLRERWNQRFKNGMTFGFLAVAGDADEFVPRTSSLDPFDEEYRKIIGGNHLVIVKPQRETDQTVSTIKSKILYNNNYSFDWEPSMLAVEYSDFKSAIENYDKVGFENLDTRNKVNYIMATESLGNSDKALELALQIESESSDALGVIGGRFKRHYVNTGSAKSLSSAISSYEKGLSIATEKENNDQVYYHAINLAFLKLMSDENSVAKQYAQQALDAAESSSVNNVWKYATIGEAHIHFNETEKAVQNYKTAASKASNIREKDSILINAIHSADMLGWTEVEKDWLVTALA